VGAGRKASGKVPVLLSLSPATAKRLRVAAKRSHLVLSEITEIEASLASLKAESRSRLAAQLHDLRMVNLASSGPPPWLDTWFVRARVGHATLAR